MITMLSACGGGGGGDSGSGSVNEESCYWCYIEINKPAGNGETFRTQASSVGLSGTAFKSPQNADCVNVFPVQLSLTWHNTNTGQTGLGAISSVCIQDPFWGTTYATTGWNIYGGINLQPGSNVINVTAKDSSGNSSTATITIVQEEVIDVTLPSIVNTSPVQNGLCVAVNTPVTATFDEAIDPDSLNSNSFYLQDSYGNLVTSTLSYVEPEVSLQPQTILNFNSTYTATLTQAITDYAGNTLNMDYMLNFTTADNVSGNWVSTSINVAPTLATPVAVWTGYKMIVWGDDPFNGPSGGVYDPVIDSWSELSSVNAPPYGSKTSAVWTGTEMIIWGGRRFSEGYAYDPGTDSWRTISSVGAPSARYFHNAVWTGSEMIIWGGTDGKLSYSDGARYNPFTDSWTPVSNTNAPSNTDLYSNTRDVVWAGTEMIIWKTINSPEILRYNPATDIWKTVSSTNAPAFEEAVWTGTEMLVWDGSRGARYDLKTDAWSNMSIPCGFDSNPFTTEAVWTGSEMVIWDAGYNHNGVIYTPVTDSWEMMNITNAPASRVDHVSVWTGSEVIVWGGRNRLITGGRFFPQPPRLAVGKSSNYEVPEMTSKISIVDCEDSGINSKTTEWPLRAESRS